METALFLARLWRGRKFYAENKVSYTFNKDNFLAETRNGKVELKWERIKKIAEDRNYFYIYFPLGGYSFIPKKAFDKNSLKEFFDLISEKQLLRRK